MPRSVCWSSSAQHPRAKELVGFQTGVRESAQSWRELLVDIKGLEIAPDLAVGDSALGFWKAIEEVFPGTTALLGSQDRQRPEQGRSLRSGQHESRPSRGLRRADPCGGRGGADVFADKYAAKYEKAAACLTKDREALLAFFDFPAEHWDHLRTSQSRACSRRCGIEPCGQREPCRRRPPGSWSSNLSTPLRKDGDD